MGKDVNKLGSYRAQIRKLKEKRTNLVKQYIKLMEEIKDVNVRLSSLNIKLDAYMKSDFFVSEHFILRFRERVKKDITVPEIKKLVFNERFVNCIRILDDGEYPCEILEKEYKIIVKGKTLVTITP